MKWQRWHGWAAGAAVVALGLALLKKCDGSSPTVPDAGIVEAPAATPGDLLCDLYIAAPNSSWGKLQRGVGGAVGILPANLPGVVIALTDLDPQLAVELDGSLPMYGAVSGDPAEPSFAFAMKLVDPRRARVLLINGDAGRYAAKEAAGMTVLVPNRPSNSAAPKLAIAISQNGYLLITKQEADFARLGPYVTRTLTARPPPSDPSAAVVVEIPRKALQTAIKPKLESFWKDGKSFLLGQDERMRAERGRPPDFGDPVAIIGTLDAVLGRRVAVVGDLEKVRLVLDITEDAAMVTATLTPDAENKEASGGGGAARKWIDTMRTGDSSSVLSLPSTSALALSMRDDEVERVEQGASLEKAIVSALGSRLKEPDKLHDVIDAMTKTRDESFALAVGLDDPSGALLRAPVRDADAAQKAIRGVLDLARSDPFKDLLRVRDITSSSEELPGLGKISIATMVQQPKKNPSVPAGATTQDEKPLRRASDAGAGGGGGAGSKDKSKPSAGLGVAYIVDQGALSLGAGSEPLVTLKLGARPEHKLADEPSLKRFISTLGNDASTIIVLQPLRLDPKRANLPTAPVGIAIGKKGNEAFVRFDISDGLLREAARWQMGF